MAINTGEGGRRGAVKDRVQLKNPVTGNFIKLDTVTGRMIDEKKSPGPFKGVRVLTASNKSLGSVATAVKNVASEPSLSKRKKITSKATTKGASKGRKA